MDGNNGNMQHFEKIFKEESSIIDPSDDVIEVIDLTGEDSEMGPSSSAMSMVPSTSSSTVENGSNNEKRKLVGAELNPVPEVNIEVNHDSKEIILDFLQKDAAPYYGVYSSRCNVGSVDLGLCIMFNVGTHVTNRIKKEENEPSVELTPPRRGAALYCGVCSESHIQILQSGKSLISSFCGHVFCNVCVDESEESHKKCLTCGQKLTSKQYHFLYQ